MSQYFQSSDCSSTKSTYCDIKSDHSMCKYCGTNTDMCNQVCSRGITAQADKDAIVAKHNELRRKVAKGQESRVNNDNSNGLFFSNSQNNQIDFDESHRWFLNVGCWRSAAICHKHVWAQMEWWIGRSCAKVGWPMYLGPWQREGIILCTSVGWRSD